MSCGAKLERRDTNLTRDCVIIRPVGGETFEELAAIQVINETLMDKDCNQRMSQIRSGT